MDDWRELGASLLSERDAAKQKAWKALAGYKFWMFGYWAAWWVKLNQLCPGAPEPSPWKSLVDAARQRHDGSATRRKTGAPASGEAAHEPLPADERRQTHADPADDGSNAADLAAEDAATAEPRGRRAAAEPDPPLREPGRG